MRVVLGRLYRNWGEPQGRTSKPTSGGEYAYIAAENVLDLVNALTPEEKEAVREFVLFLKGKRQQSSSPFLAAVDEFIEQHPELLRRLAQ